MPLTLVVNADSSVGPALGTWIGNHAELLKGFSLLIAEDVLAELSKRESLAGLSITSCRGIRSGSRGLGAQRARGQ